MFQYILKRLGQTFLVLIGITLITFLLLNVVPGDPPAGCVFHTRCYKAREICKTQVPELRDCGNGHCCACHFPEQPQA